MKKGSEGDPGELVGVFKKPEIPIGTVTANNDFGLFGEVTNPSAVTETEPVPAASKEEIKTGPAEMICTVNEKGPEKYKIEILRINRSDKTGLKNMVIEVTDETLIEKTGGIVQGMSGSPIIQNGKLIGAVTHVFLNDPKRGYGIFIENMLE